MIVHTTQNIAQSLNIAQHFILTFGYLGATFGSPNFWHIYHL